MPENESISLYYREGSSDKFYSISLIREAGSWNVPFTYGRRGSVGNNGFKITDATYEKAKRIYDKVVAEKTGKGYTTDSSATPTINSNIPRSAIQFPNRSSTIPSRPASGVNSEPTAPLTRKISWRETVPAAPALSEWGVQLLQPIEEEEVKQYINDNEYVAQEKFDGKRMVLVCQDGTVTAVNRKGKECGCPPEYVEAVLALGTDCVLDGEGVGGTYWAFDCLSIGGQDVRNEGYGARYSRLAGLIQDEVTGTGERKALRLSSVVASKSTKQALLSSLRSRCKEGIVFKSVSAPYRQGRFSTMLKNKFYATASVIVTGHNEKNSVSVGVRDGEKIISVGNVTTIGHKKDPIGSIIEVRYLYYFPGGSLYQPTYLGLRDDLDQKDCGFSQLKAKSEDDVDNNFLGKN